MIRVLGYEAIGAAVLCCASATGFAADQQRVPAIVLIVQGGGADTDLSDRARRTMETRLRALGAPVLGAAGMPVSRPAPAGKGQIRLTALKRPATDPSAADLVIALATESRLQEGAYTRRLRLTVRADLYPSDGGVRRSLQSVRERRLPAACRTACTARLAGRMAGEAARGLAPQIFSQARIMVPVPARRIALSGFKPREIKEIRAYLGAFPGYVRMDRGRARGGATVIRYASRLDRQRLQAALGKMLSHLDMAAVVGFKGRDVTVTRSAAGRPEGGPTRQW